MNPANQQLMKDVETSPPARAKIAAKMGTVVRDKLREVSFWEGVLPPEPTTAADVQSSPNHDGPVRIVELEPNTRAIVMNWTGSPDAKIMRAPRIEASFFTIMSDMWQKPEEEFMVYSYSLGDVVRDNSVRDMAAAYDREGIVNVEAAVQSMQAEFNGGSVTTLNATAITGGSVVEYSVVKGGAARVSGSNDDVVHPLTRDDIRRLVNVIDGRELHTKALLMTNTDWNSIMSWSKEELGDKISSETVVDGYRYNTLIGYRVTVTIKTNVLRPGNVYGFTDPQFLGRAFILNNTKFWIDKTINWIKFVAWRSMGSVIANISSCSKMELYSGDATLNDADGILENVSPVSGDAMFRRNNRAAERRFFPEQTFY